MAHFSPILFPFVSIGVEHGMNRSPVLSTSLIKIFKVWRRLMRIYAINHFLILAKFSFIPIFICFYQCLIGRQPVYDG